MVSSDRENSKEKEHICDICGSLMMERNCRIICLNCGYTRDCSDP